MHAGSDIEISCYKSMEASQAEAFLRDTDAGDLAASLQNERDDHLDGYCTITCDPADDKGAQVVRILFCTEVEDMLNVENWCDAEGFEITSSLFGRRVGDRD